MSLRSRLFAIGLLLSVALGAAACSDVTAPPLCDSYQGSQTCMQASYQGSQT